MDNEPKIFLGNGIEKFDGDVVEFSLNLTKLGAAKEHFFEFNNDKFVKLKVCKKRDGMDEHGKTHYVQVDTWKPTPRTEPQRVTAPAVNNEPEDDIPF